MASVYLRHLKPLTIMWLNSDLIFLTHWDRVTHICVGYQTIIGSDNGLSPGRRQAIIWTNAGILLIGPLGTNFSEILIGIHKFSFTKMHLKMSSAKWRLFSLGLNVLKLVLADMDVKELKQLWKRRIVKAAKRVEKVAYLGLFQVIECVLYEFWEMVRQMSMSHTWETKQRLPWMAAMVALLLQIICTFFLGPKNYIADKTWINSLWPSDAI